jgi:hypothetical protein
LAVSQPWLDRIVPRSWTPTMSQRGNDLLPHPNSVRVDDTPGEGESTSARCALYGRVAAGQTQGHLPINHLPGADRKARRLSRRHGCEGPHHSPAELITPLWLPFPPTETGTRTSPCSEHPP